jgi:hypothetical protein
MRIALIILAAVSMAFQSSATEPPQLSNAKVAPAIKVIDEAGKIHRVSTADISRMPRQKIKTKDRQTEVEFEGVTLVDLLKSQGVAFGNELRGARAATVAVCEAADGYRVPVALLEIDPDTSDTLVLIADRRDGKPFDEKQGPFRLVIPGEKRPIRWIRMLQTIRVINMNDLATPHSQNEATGQRSK